MAAEFGLGVLPYYSLASGFLAGKYRSASDHAGTARQPGATRYLTPAGTRRALGARSVAAAHGTEARHRRAGLAAHTRPNVVAPLASARTVDQLPALLASATLDLTVDEVEALDKASAA